MPSKSLLREYARLVVKVGVNVQRRQRVIFHTNVEHVALTRLIVQEAYKAGASHVEILWSDNPIDRLTMKKGSIKVLEDVPDWKVERYKYFASKDICRIVLLSDDPDLYEGIDSEKIQRVQKATSAKLNFFRKYFMNDEFAWSIIAAPNYKWAKKVFPELPPKKAFNALWDAILKTARVEEGKDVIQTWNDHMDELARHSEILNKYNFKSLHFKNSLGTNLTIELAKDHLWHGGRSYSKKGVAFEANIPTEENYTMPHKTGVNGKVVASKPLAYQGKLISDFWIEFKDGKAVKYDAKQNLESLKNLIEFDEGSSYLGEIALVPYHSPISMSGLLFYETLFDENASCHMALGAAYPTTIKGGEKMSKEELVARGYNDSMMHDDFMFGTPDLSIIGKTHDGKEVVVFKNGDFAF